MLRFISIFILCMVVVNALGHVVGPVAGLLGQKRELQQGWHCGLQLCDCQHHQHQAPWSSSDSKYHHKKAHHQADAQSAFILASPDVERAKRDQASLKMISLPFKPISFSRAQTLQITSSQNQFPIHFLMDGRLDKPPKVHLFSF